MTAAELSSVAYKKGNWMRYTLWGLAVICIVVLGMTFANMMNGEISAAVPNGYRFSVTDNYLEGSNIRTTYYVYDDKIIVEDQSVDDGTVNRAVMVYDNLDTSSLTFNEEETAEICNLGTCRIRPKIISTIKKMLSKKVGREYIGL